MRRVPCEQWVPYAAMGQDAMTIAASKEVVLASIIELMSAWMVASTATSGLPVCSS